MKKFIAYYRVSTKKQGLGLEAQKSVVEKYIANAGGVLVGEYSEKETGKDNKRVELMKALAECKKEGATLIIAKLDRLSRNVSFIFALRDSGVNFYCCDIPELNTLNLGIFATIAQHERELISDRTKKALAEKAKTFKLGAPNPVITPEMRVKSAETLREIANSNENNIRATSVAVGMFREGKTLQAIADHLNENAFKTSKGCEFTRMAVSRLIRRYQMECYREMV